MSDQPNQPTSEAESTLPCPICGENHPTLREFIECAQTKGSPDQQMAAIASILNAFTELNSSTPVLRLRIGLASPDPVAAMVGSEDPTHGENCTECELFFCPGNKNPAFKDPAINAKLN